MTWIIGQKIVKMIEEKNLTALQKVLKPLSLKKRECIMSEKIKGASLLYIAVRCRSVNIVEFFLKECGANPNDFGYENRTRCPCLWKAASINNFQTVQILLQHGADVDGIDSLESTALFVACSRGNLDVVRILWCNGADVNATNHEGDTCLMASIAHPKLCRYLIGVGAHINTVNAWGDSALVLAIKSKQKETVTVLLDSGANPFYINHYGVNAIFLMTYMDLQIYPDYFDSIHENSKNCEAIALEILSCKQMVGINSRSANAYWKKALKLRRSTQNTQMFHCPNSFRSKLRPVLCLLTGRDAQVMKFIEFRLGLQHPLTLDLLKDAVLKINRIEIYTHLFSFFIGVILSSENKLFLKISHHIDDMFVTFHWKYSQSLSRSISILKSLADYLEDAYDRIQSMNEAAKLSYAYQIDSCHKLILNYISLFAEKCPDQIEDIHEHVSRIVKLDTRGNKNSSLLHFCIENNYSVNLAMILVACGANINAMDDNGEKPAHYALISSEYSTKEVINSFLIHGLRFEMTMKEVSCLPCLLNKRNLLKNSLHYITLQCLAAETVAKYYVFGEYSVPRPLQMAIQSHSRI